MSLLPMRGAVGELIGTAFLVMAVIGSAIAAATAVEDAVAGCG